MTPLSCTNVVLSNLSPSSILSSSLQLTSGRSVEVSYNEIDRIPWVQTPLLIWALARFPLQQFSLTADWPTWELSPLQEAAVYLADELEGKGDASLLWRFIEKLEGSRNAIDQAITGPRFQLDQLDAVWALTLAQTSDLIPSLSHSLMHLYLGIRTYSPTLELHRSLRKGKRRDLHTSPYLP